MGCHHDIINMAIIILGGLQVGGGINLENAMSYLNEGASHVIVTSVRAHALICVNYVIILFLYFVTSCINMFVSVYFHRSSSFLLLLAEFPKFGDSFNCNVLCMLAALISS
jgi:hypothetical protein